MDAADGVTDCSVVQRMWWADGKGHMWDGGVCRCGRGGGGREGRRELHYEAVGVGGAKTWRDRQREFGVGVGRWGGWMDVSWRGTKVGDADEVGFQLLSSSSVAVSTSQDFDDSATITAFWEEKEGWGRGRRWKRTFRHLFCTCTKVARVAYFFEAHGTEFVYFACVLGTGNGSACINMRPEPRRLFEHLLVLLVLCEEEHKRHQVSAPRSTAQTTGHWLQSDDVARRQQSHNFIY